MPSAPPPTREITLHPSTTMTDPVRLRLADLVHGRTETSADTAPQARRPGEYPRLLLTIPEAARALGLGRSTLYELIAAERLEVVHIGRATRIPVDALDSFLAELRQRPVR